MVDADTTTYNWYSTINGVVKEQDWLSNTATGYYEEHYSYDALALSGPTDAYHEGYHKTIDPLSGINDYDYSKEVDFDGDHMGSDDWYYHTWDSYAAGTGEGSKGTNLYNNIDGIWDNNDYSYNSSTGWYTLNNNSYRNTDGDTDWYNNYYTTYYESYNASNGWLSTKQDIYDYSKVVYSAATWYERVYNTESSNGSYYEKVDARTDTNGDGNWNDYGFLGASPGAYRDYSESYFYSGNGSLQKNREIWNALSNVYTRDLHTEYAAADQMYDTLEYQWDADKDGSFTDDYYYHQYNASYTGYNSQSFYKYDYLTDLTGDGTPDASYVADTAYSYSSGNYGSEHKYAQDTNADGIIETGSTSSGGNDYWNDETTSFNATSGNELTTVAWTSDDYNNSRDAFWYSRKNTYDNADTGDNWVFAQSANLGGYVQSTSGTYSGGNDSAFSSYYFYNLGLIGQPGQTWNTTVSAIWGDSMTGSGSYSYSGGDSGTWTFADWDKGGGGTDYYKTHAFQLGISPYALGWEIKSKTWNEAEGAWQYAGYQLDDGITGNKFYYQKGMSPNGDFQVWETTDGATGNYNDVEFRYDSGATTPSFGSSEWDYGSGKYEHWLYSGAANAWYLYYADPYPSI